MSLAATPPSLLFAAQRTTPERARPPDPTSAVATNRRQIKPACVREGRTSYPYVGDITRDGVEIYHHSSRQGLPVEWRELIHGGADLYGMSPAEFLEFLARQVSDPDTTLSGPSAPSSETEHGHADGRSQRR